MEDYDPPTPGYDPPTWQQKLEFKRSSFRPQEKQAYEEQLVAMDMKRFLAPFSLKGCAVPYKITRERTRFLYARYKSRLRELKYIEDCWVEHMNEGKLNLPASPLPSFPGQDPKIWNSPRGFTDMGGRGPDPEGFFPTWDAQLDAARASQIAAVRALDDDPSLACPPPPKQSARERLYSRLQDQILSKELPKSREQTACKQCW